MRCGDESCVILTSLLLWFLGVPNILRAMHDNPDRIGPGPLAKCASSHVHADIASIQFGVAPLLSCEISSDLSVGSHDDEICALIAC